MSPDVTKCTKCDVKQVLNQVYISFTNLVPRAFPLKGRGAGGPLWEKQENETQMCNQIDL